MYTVNVILQRKERKSKRTPTSNEAMMVPGLPDVSQIRTELKVAVIYRGECFCGSVQSPNLIKLEMQLEQK